MRPVRPTIQVLLSMIDNNLFNSENPQQLIEQNMRTEAATPATICPAKKIIWFGNEKKNVSIFWILSDESFRRCLTKFVQEFMRAKQLPSPKPSQRWISPIRFQEPSQRPVFRFSKMTMTTQQLSINSLN